MLILDFRLYFRVRKCIDRDSLERSLEYTMDKKKPVAPVNELIVSLPGKEIKLFITADFEALITDLEDAEKVPCWAAVWPAAYGLACHIWEHITFRPDEEVLELGAGMGLPGIVCGLKGARLTLSDFNSQALEMARYNARANGVEPELLLADWRSFPEKKHFDLILASDILYDPKLNPSLGPIFHKNLRPGGRIFIAHPQREATFEFIQDWYDASLFTQQIHWETVELEDALLPRYKIAIQEFKKQEDSGAKG